MFLLAQRLKRAGHQTTLFGYHVTVQSLEAIADRLVLRVEEVLGEDEESLDQKGPDPAQPGSTGPAFALVGHSLGNVICRMAAPALPPGLRCQVMLAPPNHSPVAARWLEGNSVFRLLTQDAGQKLTDPAFFARLPKPRVPTLVIAGTAGSTASWLPFEGRPNDGVVAVEETALAGAETVQVKAIHTFLMNRRDVFQAVRAFLEKQEPERT
jgi:pimeloyl-ACP methyl ester carboxylesterase